MQSSMPSRTTIYRPPLAPRCASQIASDLTRGCAAQCHLASLDDLDIDLGSVISARAAWNYDPCGLAVGDASRAAHRLPPMPSLVEYAAHPQAKLYLDTPNGLPVMTCPARHRWRVVEVAPAYRPVAFALSKKEAARPTTVRLHLHGEAGEYLPARRHRKVNGYWFEDNYGEFADLHNQYAYVDGFCEVDLPLGTVYVEISRGYEVAPIRTAIEVTAESDSFTFELEKVLHWREAGWVTADTHVHFLSPQTALLEGKAEGVNVVNLLASQWGEMYSNVSDFDGKTHDWRTRLWR